MNIGRAGAHSLSAILLEVGAAPAQLCFFVRLLQLAGPRRAQGSVASLPSPDPCAGSIFWVRVLGGRRGCSFMLAFLRALAWPALASLPAALPRPVPLWRGRPLTGTLPQDAIPPFPGAFSPLAFSRAVSGPAATSSVAA